MSFLDVEKYKNCLIIIFIKIWSFPLFRSINYDEKDPFLCTSCGFCKFAKFDFTLNAHSTCSVESIKNEEDREKALKSVNNTLEKADQHYKQLSMHRYHLESLFKLASTENHDGQVINQSVFKIKSKQL